MPLARSLRLGSGSRFELRSGHKKLVLGRRIFRVRVRVGIEIGRLAHCNQSHYARIRTWIRVRVEVMVKGVPLALAIGLRIMSALGLRIMSALGLRPKARVRVKVHRLFTCHIIFRFIQHCRVRGGGVRLRYTGTHVPHYIVIFSFIQHCRIDLSLRRIAAS